ncbi:MAG: hypothetical protein KAG86_11040 [Gammaproteobacteria bacterium]|nr:hypothetical protein [Gammaproteobacteria bacterium]
MTLQELLGLSQANENTSSQWSGLLGMGDNKNMVEGFSSNNTGNTSSLFGGGKEQGGFFQDTTLGDYGSLLQGLGGIGQLGMGWMNHKAARKDADFAKKTTENNMKLQMQALNNQMELQAANRHDYMGGQSPTAQDYMATHRLNLGGIG